MRPYIEQPKTQIRRLEPMGLTRPSTILGLMGMGPGLARQEAVGRVFGLVLNRTEQSLQSEPDPLAVYPDSSLTLIQGISRNNDWRNFTKLLYNMFGTLATQLEKIVMKMRSHAALLQKADSSELENTFLILQMKSGMKDPKETQKSLKLGNGNTMCNVTCSETKKYCDRQSQEHYRCCKIGHNVGMF